ncbi:MAG: hypothetical protein JXB49_18275 [Bacteroidales bacterium]|nr:hypothetical protein [Bacteroidales bacterium]
MRKLFLSLAIVLSGMLTMAQEPCQDVIYAEDGRVIVNCCIYEILDGNMVYYTLGNDTAKVSAVAIDKDGRYIDLGKFKATLENAEEEKDLNPQQNAYNPQAHGYDQSYEYYKEEYRKATGQRNTGIVLTIAGILLEAGGLMSAAASSSSDASLAAVSIGLGSLFEIIGIPMWIAGGVKRANNKRAMQQVKAWQGFSLGMTRNGVGLAYRF